jgi:hypothetical protein
MIRPVQPPSRHGLAAWLAWAVCSALYLWTANGVVVRDDDRTNAWHHYEYLVDGFLSGHLYLSPGPAKELLALPDPYDPQQNLPYRLWDASLYQGRYYLYYGPTPAVLLMLPWKVVTGHHLPQRLATGIFAVAGLGALALLLAGVRRRLFPAASPVLLSALVVLAAHLTWLPVILRRPAFWELPIVTAAALFWWSLYFLWRYHESGGRRAWAWAAGVALALLPGARPTYLFAAGLVAVLFALPYARAQPWTAYLRRLLPVGIPLLLGIGGLLAYNGARFGAPLEFGQSYQLWGMEERTVLHFSTAYFPFNAWCYLFSLPDVSPYFPFVHPSWTVAELPAGYIATEEVFGLLFALPAQVLAAAALLRCWQTRRDDSGRSLRLLIVAAAGASLMAGAVLFCFAGACSRYVGELLAGWTVVTGIGGLVVFSPDGGLRRPGVARLLGIVAAVWSVAFVWLASCEFRGFARTTQPVAYGAVARLLNHPSHWAARRAGVVFGPVALAVRLPATPATGSAVLLAAGSENMLNRLLIERLDGGRYRLRLTVNDLIMVETPPLPAGGPVLHLRCWAPWLYPPAAHPFWDALANARERELRQTLYALEVDGASYARRSRWGFDATSFEPSVQSGAGRASECAWVESLSRLEAGPASLRPAPPP